MTKSILVTGGAGYIGAHTVVELASSGYRPVIVDNFSNSEEFVINRLEKLVGSKLAAYKLDVADKAKMQQVITKEGISGIIHFAAYKQVGESVTNPLKYYKNNVSGLISLLETVTNNPVIESFVFSSSCMAYGQPDSLPVTEESPIQTAESPYGATKQMCETILYDLTKTSSHLRSISLRYFNPIGAHHSSLIGELPKGTPANLLPLITQASAGLRDSLTIYGDDWPTPDGTAIRDYIHVVDLARAHVKAIDYAVKQNPPFYDVFNIGSGKGSSVMEVIKEFEKATGVKVPYKVGPRRNGDIAITYASVDKANEILGWKATKAMSEALKDAWMWQKSL